MWQKLLGLGIALALAIAAPHAVELYQVEILIILAINLILVQSYRLVNTTGDWSLSHIVIMGTGAYGAALLSKLAGLPFWLTVPLGGAVAAICSFLIVFPLLRTVGFGFFIASFALGEFIRLIWIKFNNPFGGSRGMIGIPPAEIGPWDLSGMFSYYYVCLFVAFLSLLVMYRIDRSRIGDTFKAIHTDPDLCESVGIRVPRYRAMAFVVGNFFAGIAGALMAHHQGAIDPHNFEATLMVYLIIYVVVGGVLTFWGPILGVILMTIVFEATRFLEAWRPLIAGAILIFFLVVMPGGVEILIAPLARLMRRIPLLRKLVPPEPGELEQEIGYATEPGNTTGQDHA